MTSPAKPSPLAVALADFHARVPIRAWSLIVTVYGDCVMPRGGEMWLGTLTSIMKRAGVDEGSVRTAVSRLAREGWIARVRHGRNSFYSLSAEGERAFRSAAARIYAARPAPFSGRWELALLPPGEAEAGRAARAALKEAGFGQAAPATFVRPERGRAAPAAPGAIHLSAVPAEGEARRLAAIAWPLTVIAERYGDFLRLFGEVEAGLDGAALDDLDALVLRVLLVHAFRRIVLKDPDLPPETLPADWPGAEARALFHRTYRRLAPAAERWLDANGARRDGPLPTADETMARRLAG